MPTTLLRLSLSPFALFALAACMEQQSLDRTQSRFVTVEGRRMKVDLSATGQPQEFDLLVVRDSIVGPRATIGAGATLEATCVIGHDVVVPGGSILRGDVRLGGPATR